MKDSHDCPPSTYRPTLTGSCDSPHNSSRATFGVLGPGQGRQPLLGTEGRALLNELHIHHTGKEQRLGIAGAQLVGFVQVRLDPVAEPALGRVRVIKGWNLVTRVKGYMCIALEI